MMTTRRITRRSKRALQLLAQEHPRGHLDHHHPDVQADRHDAADIAYFVLCLHWISYVFTLFAMDICVYRTYFVNYLNNLK